MKEKENGRTFHIAGNYIESQVFNINGGTNYINTPDDVKEQEDGCNSQRGNDTDKAELFHFIHPEVEEDEAWGIHKAIERLVKSHRIPEICTYLKELKDKKRILLPTTSDTVYDELVRLGMPTGEGFSKRHFQNNYIKK